jgi:glycerophosphoryl diester phosphodiesterase
MAHRHGPAALNIPRILNIPQILNSPEIMSHRGELRSHPENTLPAFESALAAGIRYLEFDLQINASGTPVALHDASLSRTHGVDRSVFDHTDGAPPVLPVLAEVLDLADRYPGTVLCLEVKHDSLDHWGEAPVWEKLMPWTERIEGHVLLARSTSFLQLAREAGLPTIGVILRQWSPAVRERMTALAPELLVINWKRVPRGEDLWPGPWQWAVYEVGDFSTALRWGERGADFVLSHYGVELLHERQALDA